MKFFRIKNRPSVVVSSMIVVWLIYVNVFLRFSLHEKVEYINDALGEYSASKPEDFETLVLGLSSNLGFWDDTKHRVVTLLRPEHCALSYWMGSAGSESLAKVNILMHHLDGGGITEAPYAVDVFLLRDAPSIIVDLQAADMTVEQCEEIDGYYSGGCRYTFETRSVRFFTLQTAGFPEMLGRLIKQCGGGRMQA